MFHNSFDNHYGQMEFIEADAFTDVSPEYDFQIEGEWEGFDDEDYEGKDFDPESMTLGEINDFFENTFALEQSGEIAPIVGTLISALPAVIKGVSGLVKNFSKPKTPTRPMAVPAPRPQAPARPAVSATAPPATVISNSANILAGLLQNPAIGAALQGLTKGGNTSVSVGGAQIPIGSILNVISQLASSLEAESNGGNFYYPDFYYDSEDNMIVNPESPENIGEHILNLLNK
ncbi:MAG: hypothetical protein R2828_07400 [Saprospiraceae bacterium]